MSLVAFQKLLKHSMCLLLFIHKDNLKKHQINAMHLFVLQVVGPADGSAYVIDYYGPRLTHIAKDMDTYFKPRE